MKKLSQILMPHQRGGLKFAFDHPYSINGDDMGLGKTIQALALAEHTGHKALVICPPYLKENWAHEIRTKLPEWSCSVFKGMSDVREDNLSRILIAGYTQLPAINKVSWRRGLCIADEVHYLKTPNSKRTEAFHTLLEKWNPPYFMGLSGSIIENRVPELYSLLCLPSYDPAKKFGRDLLADFDYKKFCSTFCHCEMVRTPQGIKPSFFGYKNLDLLAKYIDKKLIRREFGKIFPGLGEYPTKYIKVNQSIIYDQAELLYEFENSKYLSSTKRINAELKAPQTAKIAAEIYEEEGEPLVIFSDHPIAAGAIHKELDIKFPGKCRLINAEVPAGKRFSISESFQKGEFDIVIGTIETMAEGLNFFRSNTTIFNDLNWKPLKNKQARARTKRKGQTRYCKYIVINGTDCDEYINRKLIKKTLDIEECYKLIGADGHLL